jgi:rubrerythrin
MSTIDNLKEAFAGESQANRKYTIFAEKAEEEGFLQAAKLFRAAAAAEAVHARSHLAVMEGIKGTKENIQTAISGEISEFESMYPDFIKKAKSENNELAVLTFHNANEVEKIHAELYKNVLENLGTNEKVDYYVCDICGNTVEKEPPEICPICSNPKSGFELIK